MRLLSTFLNVSDNGRIYLSSGVSASRGLSQCRHLRMLEGCTFANMHCGHIESVPGAKRS